MSVDTLNGVKIRSRAWLPPNHKTYLYWFECGVCGNGFARLKAKVKKAKNIPNCGCKKPSGKEHWNANREPINKLGDLEASLRTAFTRYKISAKRRNLKFTLSEKSFRVIVQQNCFYCNASPNNFTELGGGKWRRKSKVAIGGIDRRINSIGYTEDNCAPCCKDCNYFKGSLDIGDFLDMCNKIAAYGGKWAGWIP